MASGRNKGIVVSHEQPIVPLSTLKPKQENIAITVRVLRSWEVYLPRSGDKPAAVEMVLVDKEVGVPIMLMRNIDKSAGLCNGTRLMVDHLGTYIITTTVLTGKNIGDKILIPRMNLIPSDAGLPFKFQRRQFPVTVCFAMTINKSQGQSLSYIGLYLPKPVFTHGQLYVALSRVKSRRGMKLLILDEDNNVLRSTKNVVYREVFENV